MNEHARAWTGAAGRRGSVDVSPAPGALVACGSVVFRHRGQLRVAVIAKATFSFVPDGFAALAPPAPGVLTASDRVPYRPRVDVTFTGHAHAVRLGVFRERAVVDKAIHVDPTRLGAPDRSALDAAVVEIPDDFDWRYFQDAPPDQQIDALRGDEWIVLDGLHPTLPCVRTRLPSPAVSARVHGLVAPADEAGEPLALVADTLAIDGDRQACDILWRGSVAIPGGEPALAGLRILVGLHTPSGAATESPAPPADAADGADVTLAFSMPVPIVAPFPLAKPGSTRPAAAAIAGAPWSAAPAPPVPQMVDALAQTLLPSASPLAARAPASPAPPPADHERPRGKRAPPALPLKGSIYGKPKPAKTR